ncbi:MAG: hypothetical protein ACI9YH_001971 [Colwellia sp.]|jgi:hypothetical protein
MISINKKIALTALVTVMLSACGGSSSDSEDMVVEVPAPDPMFTYSYQVTVTNLTYAQPMSPVALVLHNEGQLWSIGEMASVALENLAESGDNSAVLAESIVLSGQGGAGLLLPGMSEMVDVSYTVADVNNAPMMLSLATMLVNTNDAFTGINALAVNNLAVGESISLTTSSYDSGTEKNSELMTTIPGPAGGGTGEGFNAERDDIDKVAMHSGIVSADDGLMVSALTQAHRFDNPTLAVMVTRTE